MTNNLTLTINGNVITGWKYAEIICGIERVPRSFHVSVVWNVDEGLAKSDRLSPAGQPCVVKYKDQPLITGYVDVVHSQLNTGEHEISYIGRGTCEDVVDGTFEFYSGSNEDLTNLKIGVPVATAVKAILDASGVKLVVDNQSANLVPNLLIGTIGMSAYSAIELFNTQTGCLL
jgi:prophage tail gpP-like protein